MSNRPPDPSRPAPGNPGEWLHARIGVHVLRALGQPAQFQTVQVRPLWDGQQFRPRTMMNLSSSFDHRIVDGWDAATFVRRLKALLETPALLFIDEPST